MVLLLLNNCTLYIEANITKEEAFKHGIDIGRLQGQRDILLELTQLIYGAF
jgi:hypothetical protein